MHRSPTSVEKRSTLHHNKKLLYLLPEMMLSLWYLKIFATMDKTVLKSPFLKEFCSALGENQHLAAVFVLKQAVFIGLPPKRKEILKRKYCLYCMSKASTYCSSLAQKKKKVR